MWSALCKGVKEMIQRLKSIITRNSLSKSWNTALIVLICWIRWCKERKGSTSRRDWILISLMLLVISRLGPVKGCLRRMRLIGSGGKRIRQLWEVRSHPIRRKILRWTVKFSSKPNFQKLKKLQTWKSPQWEPPQNERQESMRLKVIDPKCSMPRNQLTRAKTACWSSVLLEMSLHLINVDNSWMIKLRVQNHHY